MMIRLLDEVLPMGGRGALLFTDVTRIPLSQGMRLEDVRGNVHTLARVDTQDDLVTLFVENGDVAYFERLFRDVRVDATAFQIVEEE